MTFGEKVKACAYLYLPRDPEELISLLGMTILVKTSRDLARMITPGRDEVRALDPNLGPILPRFCAWFCGRGWPSS